MFDWREWFFVHLWFETGFETAVIFHDVWKFIVAQSEAGCRCIWQGRDKRDRQETQSPRYVRRGGMAREIKRSGQHTGPKCNQGRRQHLQLGKSGPAIPARPGSLNIDAFQKGAPQHDSSQLVKHWNAFTCACAWVCVATCNCLGPEFLVMINMHYTKHVFMCKVNVLPPLNGTSFWPFVDGLTFARSCRTSSQHFVRKLWADETKKKPETNCDDPST